MLINMCKIICFVFLAISFMLSLKFTWYYVFNLEKCGCHDLFLENHSDVICCVLKAFSGSGWYLSLPFIDIVSIPYSGYLLCLSVSEIWSSYKYKVARCNPHSGD